jgi:hypothetical protein
MCIKVCYTECFCDECDVCFSCVFKNPRNLSCQFQRIIIEDSYCSRHFKIHLIRPIFLNDNLGLSLLSHEAILDGKIN